MGHVSYRAGRTVSSIKRQFSTTIFSKTSTLAPELIRHGQRPHGLSNTENGSKVFSGTEFLLLAKTFSTSRPVSAVIEGIESRSHEINPSPVASHESGSEKMSIRDQLRLWEVEHPSRTIPDTFPQLSLEMQKISSVLQNPEDIRNFGDEFDDGLSIDANPHTFDKGELVDFGNQRTFLIRGDLVELRASGNRGLELAIFVRQIGKQSQFYTVSGKWIHQRSQLAMFFVPNFVKSEELDPLLPYLPAADVPEVLQDRLQTFEYALPRNVGSPLMRKMLEFWKESDAIYQIAATKLDNAHKSVAAQETFRYLSLQEIAKQILPPNYMADGDFPAPVLYAVHRALMQDEMGFRPQAWGTHRTWGQFAISPNQDMENVHFVTDQVRRYQEYTISLSRGTECPRPEKFLEFIAKAKYSIDASRKFRKYTQHGIIGPLQTRLKAQDPTDAQTHERFSTESHPELRGDRFVNFIVSWVNFLMFTNHSQFHGIAATILRATGRYDDLELNQSVGWTFLQELGVIAPWKNRLISDLNFGVTLSSHTYKKANGEKLLPGQDAMSGLRKDWGDLPVYCIDDAGANEIDDGVSIEPADLPDEYWIHVHTADPASGINPRSGIAQVAEAMTSSVYLPHNMRSMLAREFVVPRFSLAQDRPSLTFSARLNCHGELLDQVVTAGVVRNIKYMTPETVASVLGKESMAETTTIKVGNDSSQDSSAHKRTLLGIHDILENDKKNLKLLHTLGLARQSVTTINGAIMFSKDVSFRTKANLQISSDNPIYRTDPAIELKVVTEIADDSSGRDTVRDLMLLAGEVAARWCHDRGIPVINRVTQGNPGQADPREYFHRVIMPLISSTGSSQLQRIASSEDLKNPIALNLAKSLPQHILREYLSLLGSVLPSTTAAPHLALGVDMFARATSPLRRYSDLLLHWQVEAALLEEARLGHSLVGSTREDYLPFKRTEIDQLIPRLYSREKIITHVQNASQRFWAIQLLVRAWKFNEAELPPTFVFVAKSALPRARLVGGELRSLGGLNVLMQEADWFQVDDVQEGEVFEVKLADLNAYTRRVIVEPVRRVESAVK